MFFSDRSDPGGAGGGGLLSKAYEKVGRRVLCRNWQFATPAKQATVHRCWDLGCHPANWPSERGNERIICTIFCKGRRRICSNFCRE